MNLIEDDGESPLVLVADDDITIRLLAKETLVHAGFIVEEAHDGLEALSAFREYAPSVVLLDVRMPGLDGYSVCSSIRAVPGGENVPIFMITGCDDIESINKAYESGATDFITKPINWLILVHRVNYMLRAQESFTALRKSESKNRALLDAIPDLILHINAEGAVLDCKAGEEFSRLFVSSEQMEKGSIEDVLLKDLSQKVMQQAAQAVLTKEIQRFDYPLQHNGNGYHYESRIVEIGDDELLAIIQDVTNRVQVESDLKMMMERLRKAISGTIQVISSSVEYRDPYTAGHQRRVADLARAIAEEMDLPKDRIDGIRIAAVIHDLGKIGVPSEILSKPVRLNETEFNLIKTHSQVGHDILKPIDFPWPIADIVLQHHERMDGSGYPQGLQGDAICLESRIIAVADVVEAMASHRPYRPELGIDKALEEIERKQGIAYDAEVAGACIRVFREKGFALDGE